MAFFNNDTDVNVRVTSTADTGGIDKTTRAVNELERSSGFGATASTALGIAGKAAVVGVAALGAATGAAGALALKSSSDFEQNRIAFEVMLGSADKARSLMTQIADFAKQTPFELPEVVAGSKQLLAFGFAQEQIIPTMRKLGDIAAGVGVPVGQLTNVFGQVRVAGKLMGGDLLQFTNAGVPMIEGLSKVLNVSQGDVKKMVEQGKVGFKDVEQVINNMTGAGGKFGGMMDRQSKSFSGIVSNIKDGFGQVLRSAMGVTNAGDIIQGGLFDKIKGGAEKAMPIVQKLGEQAGPAMVVVMEKVGKVAGNLMGDMKKLWDVIDPILTPSFKALWKTIQEDLLPTLGRLWKEVIEPLIPVFGATLVLAIRAAMDGLNFFLDAATKVINFILDNKPFVLGLATAFGILAIAMNFNAITSAFSAAMTGAIGTMNVMRFTTIPGIMGGLAGMAGPLGFAAVAGAAVWAAASIISKWQETSRVIDETSAHIRAAQGSIDDANTKLYNLAQQGKVALDYVYRVQMSTSGSSNISRQVIDGRVTYLPKFATGVRNFQGGMALVGENGPEVVKLPSGSNVYSNEDTKRMVGGSTEINYNAPIYLTTAEATREFFDIQNRNNVLASKGVSLVRA